MTDERAWFSSAARRKITATEIADYLGVARNTVNLRLAKGLSADDLMSVARALNVNPVAALVELDKLALDEVFAFLESDGKLVESATEAELAAELLGRVATPSELRSAIARLDRATRTVPLQDEVPLTQADLDLAAGHTTVIDDSDDHDDYA